MPGIRKNGFQVFYGIALALGLGIAATSALAQDSDAAPESESKADEEPVELERIVVTGSLIRRADFSSASPIQIVQVETQTQVGQLEVADILQNATVAAGAFQLDNQHYIALGTSLGITGGVGVRTLNLRGLGDNRSLVLLNGRRPGGSGTKGATFALDLSTLPEIAVQRAEFVLDGTSSIYGSDAVAGVVNLITRRDFEGRELQVLTELPEAGGGELYRVSGILGWDLGQGSATLSAQWQRREALTWADRDFLGCGEDLYYNADGRRIDREDRSILAGTPLAQCNNLYANTVLDAFTGAAYIPSPDGVTIGPFPGYRPRVNGRYDGPEGQAWSEDVWNFDFLGSTQVINQLERLNVYATVDYRFNFWGGVDWDMDVLYSSRDTRADSWRQFFPYVSSSDFIPYPDDPTYHPGLPLSLPVMPWNQVREVDIDYGYVSTGLSGLLPLDRYLSWQLYASYSYSDGDYSELSIQASRSGDIQYDTSPPRVDYFDPAILSGEARELLYDAAGVFHTGNTVYDQVQLVGLVSGDLFSLPYGTLGAALGIEYRRFGIDDQPSEVSQAGDLWGQDNVQVTRGTNDVFELFAEAEIPLLAGVTGFEELVLNLSARAFDYDTGGSDWIWKAGLRWQITPAWMARATAGTSYRAPALYELFLGDTFGSAGQLAADPCIFWGESTNDNIRANCAALGIPPDYFGGGAPPAEIITGGGAAILQSETSENWTAGLVWTPSHTNLSIAIDYVDVLVEDEITELGPGTVIGGCYGGENFPNALCGLVDRAPADAPDYPFAILEIRNSYLNINEQRYRGIDLNLLWQLDAPYGAWEIAAQSTWNLENTVSLFDPGEVEGYVVTDQVGTIGYPDNVSNLRVSLDRDRWRFNYHLQYVSETDNSPFVDEQTTYYGFDPAFRDITMDAVFYHSVSAVYSQDNWDLLAGVNNLLDEDPDVVSSGVTLRHGNVPMLATQYDLLGRRYFLRLRYRF